MYAVERFKVYISFVHQIDCSWYRHQYIQYVTVVVFPIGDQHKRWYATPEIEQGMDLYGSPGILSRRPLKKDKAKGDRGRVQRKNLIFQPDVGYGMIGVQRTHLTDQVFSKVCEYPPVPTLIGTGQWGLIDITVHSQMI